MDESPVLLGMEMTTRVIGPAGQKLQHKLHDGNRESASLVVTICGDGSVPFPPTIILSGQNYLKRWAEHNTLNASIALSPTGYTTDSLTLEWMHEFESKTRPTGDEVDEWRLLALDNHGSHLTLTFLDYAAAHRIEVVGYIPNSTHVLQGLDVACFGAFKTHYTHALADYQKRTSCAVTKEVFLELVKEPFERTFTPNTILSAFRVSGLEPIDPGVISPDMLSPSQENSAPTVFPLDLPEPVQAMLPLLRAVKLSNPANHGSNGALELLQSAAMETSRLLKQTSAAFTVGPTTEVTSTNSLLPPQILHAPPIPFNTTQLLNPLPVEPGAHTVSELEREVALYKAALAESEARNTASRAIIDAQNCTIALQEVGLEAQRMKLSEKETHWVSNKDKLLAKKVGRRLSGPEFRAAVKADDEARAAAKCKSTAAKHVRTLKAEIRRQKSAWRKQEQVERKARRAADLKAWTEECERCRAAGTRQPKRPPMIRKAKTPLRFTEEPEEGEDKENESEDGEDEEGEIDSD
ncbi:hypothetical protein GSI_02585 [Ganoderma sinense ZZ0214-1]|uniref:DDE-1 domain-containing protein n=1 Tax=Ganoderma sinense ZZ0214-1 TaxID=1077348 RepID=A0A2G8SMJ8_9APHY|nr:hypothetical protein GSI_02585 [Ganoderma sinense ZZ0214-1]